MCKCIYIYIKYTYKPTVNICTKSIVWLINAWKYVTKYWLIVETTATVETLSPQFILNPPMSAPTQTYTYIIQMIKIIATYYSIPSHKHTDIHTSAQIITASIQQTQHPKVKQVATKKKQLLVSKL